MRKFTLFFSAIFLTFSLMGQSVVGLQATEDGFKDVQNKLEKGHKFINNVVQPSSKDYIYFEGFENSPSPTTGALPEGWVQKRTTSLAQNPETDAVTPMWFRLDKVNYPGFSGNVSGYVRTGNASLATGYTAPNFTWAISPEIAIPTSSGNPIYMEYWHWFMSGYFQSVWYYSRYHVAIKNEAGTWSVVKSVLGSVDAQPEDEESLYDEAQFVELDAYQGQTIQIAFIYEFTDGFQMAIDDIAIYEIPNNDFLINAWAIAPTFAVVPGTEIELAAEIVCNGLEGGQPNVYLKVNDVVVQTVQVSDVLEYGNSEVVEFTYIPTEAGVHVITITMDNDDINANHTVSREVMVYEHVTFAEDFEHIDWTDPENPVVIFPPDGWNVTANEHDWDWTGTYAIFEQISARAAQFEGDPEAYLVTPPIEKTDNTTMFSFWKRGLNNGITQGEDYLGHSTMVVKYSDQEWPVTEWEDLLTISFEDGDAAGYIEESIAHLPNGTYHFAFVTTSSFNFVGYLSHAIVDHVLLFKAPVEPVTVTFEVKDAEEADILDAVITLNGVTNEAGDYEFEILPGTYEYFVAKEGYLTYFGTIEVADDMTETVVLVEGENPTFTVTFTVADSEENPVEDAVITFAGVEAEAGVYVFEDVEPGVYTYSVVKAGFYTVEGTLTVIDDDVTKAIVLTPVVGVGVNTFANLTAYPNPFRDEIRVSNASEVKRVVITNLIGQQVMDVRLADSVIPTSSLPQGVYLVTFFGSNGERTVRKMVKQ